MLKLASLNKNDHPHKLNGVLFMKKYIAIASILSFLFILVTGCQNSQEANIRNGESTLQENAGLQRLSGQWNFYHNQLLEPDEILSGEHNPMEKMAVPGYWKKGHAGYGTYHLTLNLPENKIGKLQGFYIPQVFSAYRLWINDELIYENGKVATTKEDMVPKGVPTVAYFRVHEKTTNIVMQVSNFHFRNTGILGSIYLGNPSQVDGMANEKNFIEWLSIGVFLIMGLHHLNLYFSRKKEKTNLFFGLFGLFYCLRVLFIGQTSIFHFFPNISWNHVLKINFILVFACFTLYVKYFSLKFRNEDSRKILVNSLIVASLATIVFIMFTGAPLFTYTVFILYLLLILTIPYLLILIIRGIIMKKAGAKIIGISHLLLVGTVINDLLYDELIIETTILTPLGIMVFIGAQSFIISKNFATSLTKIENLTDELETTQKEIMFTLGEITEMRSHETAHHVRRVAEYSKFLALKYGLSDEEAEQIKTASTLHDVGKVSIPDAILNKPGKLTKEEFELIKTHTTLGYHMLKQSKRKLLESAAIIALTHHEKYDGTGYPKGLKGEKIPLYGRITAIADVFDALSNDRVYKKAWEMEDIIYYFKNEKEKHFDPILAEIFLGNLNEIIKIKESFET